MNHTFSCAAILFDLDGVLIDSYVVVQRHWRRWAASRDIDFASVEAVLHGRRSAEIIALTAPELNAHEEARVREAAESVDTDGLRVFPGAAELLRDLPSTRWAIATSGTLATASTRLRFGRLPMPEVLVTADDVQRGKPDPECYLLAAARLGVAPDDCIVVEDAPAGVTAARAAGMRVVAVATTHGAAELPKPDLLAPDVSYLRVEQYGDRLVVGARDHLLTPRL